MPKQNLPHVKIIVIVSILAAFGYLGFSVWVVGWTSDGTMIGDVIGTWKSFAVAAFSFWIGSSSAGKVKEEQEVLAAEKPTEVKVTNTDAEPVPTSSSAFTETEEDAPWNSAKNS